MRNFLLSLVAVMPLTAVAEFKDGNRLLSQIRGDSVEYAHALGYVIGVADTVQGITYCPPASVTAGQLVDLVRQHLEAHPAVRHLSADRHVIYALKGAWPCTEQRRNRNNDSL